MTNKVIQALDAALNMHLILLGKTRSGKSTALRLLVEHLLDQEKPVCIIDPKGDWYGIKSSATWKSEGYPVIIFGGEHADVPLNPRAGVPVAELIASGNRPCIIDLGGWMVGDRTRFFVDFASTLFRHTHGPRWLVIDEVQNFSPQGKVLDPDAGKMLHWANRLINEGSGRGLTVFSASQRPQKVHKDFVTANETLIAMRVIHPLDRRAIKDWIDGCPEADKGAEVLATLATMKRGEGWVWSPEIGLGPERYVFPMFKTYDSFAAPTTHVATKLHGWASVDLDEVKASLAAFIEEARANDAKELRARIVELERELTNVRKTQPSAEAEQRYTQGKLDGYADGYVAAVSDLKPEVQHIAAVAKALEPEIKSIQVTAARIKYWAERKPRIDSEPRRTYAAAARTNAADQPPPVPLKPAEGLSGPQQRLIDAITWWNAAGRRDPNRTQVAIVAGYKPNSGSVNTYLSSLNAAGLIEYPQQGHIALTDAGARKAHMPDGGRGHADLMRRVRAVLSGPQNKLLDALVEKFPAAMTRDELATAAGYQPGTGSFNSYASSLHSLDLIEYPVSGEVVASEWLFSLV